MHGCVCRRSVRVCPLFAASAAACAATAVTATLLPAHWAQAVDATWNHNGSGSWSGAANWTSNPSIPNGIGDTARFLGVITTSVSITQNVAGLTLGAVEINDNNNYNVIGADAITLDAAAGNALLGFAGSATHTISTAVVLNDTVTVTHAAAGATLSGAISGVGGLVKNGAGTLRIGGNSANTLAGDVLVNEGGLTLQKTMSSMLAMGGNLFIGDDVGGANADFVSVANGGMADAAIVTVNSSGLFQVLGSDLIDDLVLKAGNVTVGGGGAAFTLAGDITAVGHADSATIGGAGPLQFLDGTHLINVADGAADHDLVIATSINVSAGPITKTGSGTLVLSGASNNYVTATTVSAGRVILEASQTRSFAWTVANGASVVLATAGGARVIKTGTITIGPTGKLDLTDNKLITSSPLGTWNGSAYTAVAGLVDGGRGNASNAQWDGNGIVTTDTWAVNHNDLVSIGVAKVGTMKNIADGVTTTFAGQTVLGSDVIAMVTWGGDANLDGKINIDDYGQIDFNVGSSGSVFGWFNGDFNYDGKINIDDYGIIDFNVSAEDLIFPTGAALGAVTAVPEPQMVAALAAVLGLAALRRRCRRRRG